jgi:hypothetical protein
MLYVNAGGLVADVSGTMVAGVSSAVLAAASGGLPFAAAGGLAVAAFLAALPFGGVVVPFAPVLTLFCPSP